MGQRPTTPEKAAQAVERVNQMLREGKRPRGHNGTGPAAVGAAAAQAVRDGFTNSIGAFEGLLRVADTRDGLTPDDTLYRPQGYQQPAPSAVVNPAPHPEPMMARPCGESVRVLVIGDLHQDPRHPHRLEVLTNLARYASAQRFDHIVQIGDWSTWDSVNQHDRNETLGARLKPSIRQDMDNLKASLQAWRAGMAKGYKPKQSIVLGNHENRLERFENANPEAHGSFTRERDELFLGFGWKTRPYGELFYIQNVAYTHHPINGAGRAFGGETGPQRAANKTTVAMVSGHTHKRQLHDSGKIGPQGVISMVEVGCAMPWGEVESYAKLGITGWWWGCVPMTVNAGVITDLSFVSMLEIEDRYGGRGQIAA